jgi:2-phospho-L-lactate guanylyltransferase
VRTFAVLPVKRFDDAKQRLGEAVAGEARHLLAAAMVDDVLAALARIDGLAGVVVVTNEESVWARAGEHGFEVAPDIVERGQSEAAMIGVAAAVERGAERVLLVPGDCPALHAGEVEALLRRRGESPGVVVVPDRHGSGTNALLLAPPTVIAPAFGPGSRQRHVREALDAGITPAVEPLPSLGLDVDTAADLELLAAALEHIPAELARATRAALAELPATQA